MTDLNKVRNLIGDRYQYSIDSFVGDGTTTRFILSKHNIKTDSLETTGDITVDQIDYEEGIVILDAAPEADEQFQIAYQFSAFRDEFIEDVLLDYDVNNSSVTLIDYLLADSIRRVDYSTGIENVKASQIFDHLYKLRSSLSSAIDVSLNSNVRIVKRTLE